MTADTTSGRPAFFRSIVFKNIVLFLLILVVAVVPLALRYYQDSRDYEIKVLASRLEFFAERGVTWLDPVGIDALRSPADKQTRAYQDTLQVLNRIEKEFGVDNAVLMRRREGGSFEYIAVGSNAFRGSAQNPRKVGNPCFPTVGGNPCSPQGSRSIFDIGRPVHIHSWFPATYQSTEDTWQAGEMKHSRLFGGEVGNREFDQFLQINAPLNLNGRVVAILMLNKFAEPVAAKVRTNTLRLFGFTTGILGLGLILFGIVSSRMLRLLQHLTSAAEEVSHGNLEVAISNKRSRDEVGRLANAFEKMIDGLKQRDFIRNTFGRYLSREVVDELLNSPNGLRLGGELREVTFLVADLRGFTALSSRMEPGEVIQIVNRFLEPMVDIITRYQGTVDEFQGDGILAFFGAPVAAADDPERAVACAVEMQSTMAKLNADQKRRGLPELHMGIGINTGEVIVGNIGSEKRTKYGALGTPVNMAYRIESSTVSGQVLISQTTYERVMDVVRVGKNWSVQYKGLHEPFQVYEVEGLDGAYACSMPEGVPERFFDLDLPLAIECFIVDGKRVSEKSITGRIERLSENRAQVLLDGSVERNVSVKVRIAADGAGTLSDIYAKAVEANPTKGNIATRLVLNFTSLPDDATAYLEKIRSEALPG